MKVQAPPSRALTLLGVLRQLRSDGSNSLTVTDAQLQELTECSKRSLEYAFDELTSWGALRWSRPQRGIRQIELIMTNTSWVVADFLAEVSP